MQLYCSICYAPIGYMHTNIKANRYTCSSCKYDGKISESLNAQIPDQCLDKSDMHIAFVSLNDAFVYKEDIRPEVVAERKASSLFFLKIMAAITLVFLVIVALINDPIEQTFVGLLTLFPSLAALSRISYEYWSIFHIRKTYSFDKNHIKISARLQRSIHYPTSDLLKTIVVPIEKSYALRFVFPKGKYFQLDTWGNNAAKYHTAKEQFDRIINILKSS